jgi:ABC-type transport system involved in multi-copper enzyme maturation permease subunit
MNAPSPLAPLKQLVLDTFRQSWASGISWIMLAGTAVCVLLCLSVGISGDVPLRAEDEPGFFLPQAPPQAVVPSVVAVLAGSDPLQAAGLSWASGKKVWFSFDTNVGMARREGVETITGRMTLGFGAVSVFMFRERSDAVHLVELLLGWGIAGTLGVLLALVWTAGFMPTFLEPSTAAVLLAKPLARWQLLLGKYLGVLTFVAFQAALFVVLTWLALGVRTGVWYAAYLWCIPLLVVQFAIFYSFSVLIAVMTRSTVACVLGSVLYWLLAWGINYASVMVGGVHDAPHLSGATLALSRAGYWISPKPIDAGLILFNALEAGQHFARPLVFTQVEASGGFSPLLSILSSLVITAVLLGISIHELNSTDY